MNSFLDKSQALYFFRVKLLVRGASVCACLSQAVVWVVLHGSCFVTRAARLWSDWVWVSGVVARRWQAPKKWERDRQEYRRSVRQINEGIRLYGNQRGDVFFIVVYCIVRFTISSIGRERQRDGSGWVFNTAGEKLTDGEVQNLEKAWRGLSGQQWYWRSNAWIKSRTLESCWISYLLLATINYYKQLLVIFIF